MLYELNLKGINTLVVQVRNFVYALYKFSVNSLSNVHTEIQGKYNRY